MKRKPIKLTEEMKRAFIRKHKGLFDKYMLTSTRRSPERTQLNKLAVIELGFSKHTYWLDMNLVTLYLKMYPRD